MRPRLIAAFCVITVAAVSFNAMQSSRPLTKPLRVLFIGNSLTAANDLPRIVQAIARARGVAVEIESCTPGGFNLEDHWNRGDCRKTLAASKCNFVVLQQGPSSRPENAANLKDWAARWGDAIRESGATPALYMVWPYRGQTNGFRDVSNAYRAAADAAKGQLLAAGDAWEDVEGRQLDIALYTEDGLHPTLEGSYLAALVIARDLLDIRPADVPAKLSLASGRTLEIKPSSADVLRDAAAHVSLPRASAPSTQPR